MEEAVILRRSQKIANSETIDADKIAALAPFTHLNTAMATTVSKGSEILVIEHGNWNYPRDGERLFFLCEGTLEFTAPGSPHRSLHGSDGGAQFPIPLHAGWQITSNGACRLFSVPARFQRLNTSERPAPDNTVDILGDADHIENYLDLYRELRSGRCELPSLPEMAVRIGRAIDDPNTLNDDIARLIQLDPPLAARVIRVVNSAAYAGTNRIKTLPLAVARLGRRQLGNLAFGCIVKGMFRSESPSLNRRMQRLWQYSCRVASMSFILARHTPGLSPEHALLAGLLHNIGGIPILDASRKHPHIARDPHLLDQLLQHLGAEIGALTLHQWSFDADLIEVVEQAQNWHRIGWALADYLDVVLIAQLHASIGTPQMANLPRIDQIPAFGKLALGQLTPRHSLGILEKAQREISAIEALLQG